MASGSPSPAQMAEKLLNDIARLVEHVSVFFKNFKTHTATTFTKLQPKDYVRLIMVVGGYMLIIRPFLLKLGAKIQAKEHERVDKEGKEEAARMSANDLRSGRRTEPSFAIPGVDSDSDEDMDEATDWGKKARVRQRNFIRRKLVEHESRLHEPESDKEIEEFLVD